MNTASSCIERAFCPPLELLRAAPAAEEGGPQGPWRALGDHFDKALACDSYPAFESYFRCFGGELIELLCSLEDLHDDPVEAEQKKDPGEMLIAALREAGVTETRVRLVEQANMLTEEANIMLDEDFVEVPKNLQQRIGWRIHAAQRRMWLHCFARCCLWRALENGLAPDSLGIRHAVTLARDEGRGAYGQLAAASAELEEAESAA